MGLAAQVNFVGFFGFISQSYSPNGLLNGTGVTFSNLKNQEVCIHSIQFDVLLYFDLSCFFT